MNALVGLLGHVPVPVAYALLTGAVLAESLLLIGAFVPTLSLLLTAGALARADILHLPSVIALAAAAVVAGDALAHRTGWLLGDRLRTNRLGRRIPAAAWRRATALMASRGGQAVLVCRFLPVIRTLTPHLAGATRVPYRRVAPYSATAALLWASAEAGTGYLAAASVERVIAVGGTTMAVGASAALVAGLSWLGIRRHRRRRRHTALTMTPADVPGHASTTRVSARVSTPVSDPVSSPRDEVPCLRRAGSAADC
ncbi:DedA family protein [Streptomyces sp. NPDC003077]|uniref:DedA family protein n=1 Tax=Streptomyces sp. NPDC003077 TaxID=3154443 RepID=UPI00339FDD36